MKVFLRVVFVLSLSFAPFEAFSQFPLKEKHFISIIDAGSTGSRIYLFYWHAADKFGVPILHPVPNPGQRGQFGMTINPGIADKSFATPTEAASSLKPLLRIAKDTLGSDLSKAKIFLNATAGMRLIGDEKAENILQEVLKLFKEEGFKTVKDPKEAARIIDGSEEGIYGWLGTNYFLGKLSKGHSPVGVLDLGGASTQVTYLSEESAGRGVYSVKLGSGNFQLFSHSFLGLGMNEAYKALANEQCQHLEVPKSQHSQFQDCVTSNKTHIAGAVRGDASLLSKLPRKILEDQEFYLISGYTYIHEFLNNLQKGKASDTWLEFFKDGGEDVCTLPTAQLLASNPNVSKENVGKYCFYSAYVVSLLQKLGFDEHSRLDFRNSIQTEGLNMELGWYLGAALVEAVKLEKYANKPETEPEKTKGVLAAGIDMGVSGITDVVVNNPNVKNAIPGIKGFVRAEGNKVVGYSDTHKQGYDSWRINPLTLINYVKLESSLAVYRSLRDSNKIWDMQSSVEAGVSIVALSHFVGPGVANAIGFTGGPAFLSSIFWASAPIAAVAGGANSLYFKFPMIRDRIDAKIFGENLQEMGQVKTVYDWEEFTDRTKQNNPYLKCNFYKSKMDLLNGGKPITSQFIKRGDFKELYDDDKIFPESSYYNDWVILSGRWVRLSNVERGIDSISAIRFASIDNPFSLLDLCHSVLAQKGFLKNLSLQESLDRIAPQAGYSNITASYPIYFYTKLQEKTDSGIKKTARLIIGIEDKREEQAEKNLDAFFASRKALDDEFDRSGVLHAHKMLSHTDVKNRISDNFENLLGMLLTSKRLLDANSWFVIPRLFGSADRDNYFQFLDAFVAMFGSLNVVVKSFQANQAIPLDELSAAALDGTTSSTLVIAGKPGYFADSFYANAFMVGGYAVRDLTKLGTNIFFNVNSLDEMLHGNYLNGLKTTLPLNDLTDESKLQKSHLVCQYYEAAADTGATTKALFAPLWAPSKHLPANSSVRVVPENSQSNRTEFIEPITAKNGYVELSGRWVKTTDRGMVFATLADPSLVMGTCARMLDDDSLIPAEHRNKQIGGIIVATGNTRASMGYRVEYYVPLIVLDHGKQTYNAVHLSATTVKLAERLIKKD